MTIIKKIKKDEKVPCEIKKDEKVYNGSMNAFWEQAFSGLGTVTNDDNGIYIDGYGPFNEDLPRLLRLVDLLREKSKEEFMTDTHKAYNSIIGRIQEGTYKQIDLKALNEIAKILHLVR